MKKILFMLVLICVCGCTQTIVDDQSQPSSQINQNHVTEQETKNLIEDDHVKELMSGIKKTMPEGIYQELKNKGVVKKATDTILIGNDEEEPTLRLDFTYLDDQLIQFVNKEYGFLETLPENKVNEEQAKETAQTFAKVFLNQDVELTKTTDLSGYDTGDYVTFEDQNQNTYLVDLNRNVFLKYQNASQD